MTKAPLGEARTGANPTDRDKKGTKRSILPLFIKIVPKMRQYIFKIL
jgi:hypothetical protein